MNCLNRFTTELIATFTAGLLLTMTGCNLMNSNNPDDLPTWDDHNSPPDNYLAMELDVPETVSFGESYELTLEVTNTSDQDLFLWVGVQPGVPDDDPGFFDFTITDENNNLYWRYFYDVIQEDALTGVGIDKGETLKLSHNWSLEDIEGNIIESGSYEITGLYQVSEILDKEERSNIIDNTTDPPVHFTTEPQEIMVE